MINSIPIVVVILTATIALLISRVLYLTQPTKGTPLEANLPPVSALLVIDLQQDTIANPAYQNTDQLLKKIQQELATAKDAGIEIIYIKQVFKANPLDFILSTGKYQKNQKGSELIADLYETPSKVFTKSRNDAFSAKEFTDYLEDRQITDLVIVGADISACISATSLGARNRGYSVQLVTDAIFSTNEKTARKTFAKLTDQGVEAISSLRQP